MEFQRAKATKLSATRIVSTQTTKFLETILSMNRGTVDSLIQESAASTPKDCSALYCFTSIYLILSHVLWEDGTKYAQDCESCRDHEWLCDVGVISSFGARGKHSGTESKTGIAPKR
eukprot:1414329-Amphidinium_carterae.2